MASFTGETGEAPSTRVYRMRHETEGAAGTDFSEVAFSADYAGVISAVKFIGDAAMSGATSTAATLALLNKTQSVTPASLAFVSGTDLVAFTAKTITLSGTAANVAVAVGDVFSLAKTHASTGTQLPSGLLEVTVSRNDIL